MSVGLLQNVCRRIEQKRKVCKMDIKTYKEKEDIQHETWNLLRLLGK